LSDAEFDALRKTQGGTTDRAMVALLAEIKTGLPVRVPLVEGQSARGLRAAISRAASSHRINMETVARDGFVAVKKTNPTHARRTNHASS
jgi:hypothetical protein